MRPLGAPLGRAQGGTWQERVFPAFVCQKSLASFLLYDPTLAFHKYVMADGDTDNADFHRTTVTAHRFPEAELLELLQPLA